MARYQLQLTVHESLKVEMKFAPAPFYFLYTWEGISLQKNRLNTWHMSYMNLWAKVKVHWLLCFSIYSHIILPHDYA